MLRNEINIITIKWGKYYPADYVNRLFRAICRNTHSYKVNFYCFTEIVAGLDEGITALPLPELKFTKNAFLKEAGLCNDNLGSLKGKRVLYFDLDSVITGDIDSFIEYMNDDLPYITRDYGRDSDKVGGSNIYSWVVGTLGYIKENYEHNSDFILKKYGTASQEYLSDMLIQKYGKLNFYPNDWHISFKKHCLHKWPMIFFKEPKEPAHNVKLVNFHGDPKVHDALIGKWSTRAKLPFYKKIYKYTKPVTWISKYWF
jgi:hypothetical protein